MLNVERLNDDWIVIMKYLNRRCVPKCSRHFEACDDEYDLAFWSWMQKGSVMIVFLLCKNWNATMSRSAREILETAMMNVIHEALSWERVETPPCPEVLAKFWRLLWWMWSTRLCYDCVVTVKELNRCNASKCSRNVGGSNDEYESPTSHPNILNVKRPAIVGLL